MSACLSLFRSYAFFASLVSPASLLASLDNAKMVLSRKLLGTLHHPQPSPCVFHTLESQWHLIYHVLLLWLRLHSPLSGFEVFRSDKLLLNKCLLMSHLFLWY